MVVLATCFFLGPSCALPRPRYWLLGAYQLICEDAYMRRVRIGRRTLESVLAAVQHPTVLKLGYSELIQI